MIVVHHLDNSRSQRVLWLLEELGLPYELRRYQRDPKTMLAPPELKRIHPLGKSPVVTDADRIGDEALAESGAIVEYLLDTCGEGRLRPAPGTAERRHFTYWLHYAEGSAMPPLLLALIFGRLPKSPMPFFAKPIAKAISAKAMKTFVGPQLVNHLDWMESELAGRDWFAGSSFTAADIQMSFVEAYDARVGLGDRPRLRAWLERIRARPAYQRAIEKGGPVVWSR